MATSTPGLQLPHMAPNQANKETLANTVWDGLDNALTGDLVLTITGNTTPAAATIAAAMHVKLGGSPGAGFTFNLPTTIKKIWVIENASGQTATIQVTGAPGSTVSQANGTIKLVYSNGTNVIALT